MQNWASTEEFQRRLVTNRIELHSLSHSAVSKGISFAFGLVIQHAAISHWINDFAHFVGLLPEGRVSSNGSIYWSVCYHAFCLTSHNQSSHTGTFSLVFFLNCCTSLISSAAMYGHAVICTVVWVWGNWQGTPSPVSSLFFWVTIGWVSKGSHSSGISRSDFLVLPKIELSLYRFPCSGSLVLSEEMFQTFCKRMIRLALTHQYHDLSFKIFNLVT